MAAAPATGMARSPLFVTGTDTGVGKSLAACALLRRARDEGLLARGYKPVASGAQATPAGLRNDDALALLAAAGEPTEVDAATYANVNPYCLAPPIAPHLAAHEAGVRLDPQRLTQVARQRAAGADWLVVEGAGGWRVPLDDTLDFGDWVVDQGWPVLLVVGLRLGCLNHALLTAEAITRRGHLLGWVANHLPPAMPRAAANVELLQRRLPAPCVGEFRTGDGVEQAARALDWPLLQRRLAGFAPVLAAH